MPSRTSSAPGLGWPGSRSAGGERRRRSTPRPTPEHPRGLGGEEPPKRSPLRFPASAPCSSGERGCHTLRRFGRGAQKPTSGGQNRIVFFEGRTITVLRGGLGVPETAVNERIGLR